MQPIRMPKYWPNRSLFFALLSGALFLLSSCAHRNSNGDAYTWEDDSEEVEPLPDIGSDFSSRVRNQSEVEADQLARTTFPLVRNELVDMWIDYFTKKPAGRRTFEKWLSRSTRYIPLIKSVLKEEGLPEDLIYLSMIESGFNPRAYSRAAAVGPWQFIRGTGKRYGLNINYFVDERRDIAKSTKAAAQYLKELYQIFGSWYLAAASYNAGEGRTLNAIRTNRTRDFWELARGKKNFRRETRNYVPKIIAAALISKNPEKYGFTNIGYEEPLNWVSVDIPQGIDLRSVAQITKTDISTLKLLNAELVIGITPPDSKEKYPMRVPPDVEQTLVANIDKLKAKKVSHFIVHRVQRGQTLGAIARRYRTRVRTIMELNRIQSARRVQIGQKLRIPIPLNGRGSHVNRSVASSYSSKGWQMHRVRNGETLSGIAEAYGTNAQTLMRLNGIRSARHLKAGQNIRIRKSTQSNSSLKGDRTHLVRRGETLAAISNKYGVSVRALLRMNNLQSGKDLQAGSRIVVGSRRSEASNSSSFSFHRVRRGETLSEIAEKYQMRTRTLMRLNGIKSARSLQVGQTLKVKEDNDT